jgi:hypothetical protein
MKKQPSVWPDFKHMPDGTIEVGIECDDESLTFDGHYICLVPAKPGEKDSTGALARAEKIIAYLQGKHQMKRR